jgi:hypothetical protein
MIYRTTAGSINHLGCASYVLDRWSVRLRLDDVIHETRSRLGAFLPPLTLNSETTLDWTADAWTVPIDLIVSHVYNFGHQPVSLAVGGRWFAETSVDGPDWSPRAVATFLFPTGG